MLETPPACSWFPVRFRPGRQRSCIWFVLASVLTLFGFAGWRLFAAGPPQTDPRLVDLRVIAVDNLGRPVTDLTSDDFQVTDAGKPQKIALLRYTDTSQWETKAPPPGDFSNRGTGQVSHATVILLDLLNQSFATQAYSLSQMDHYLGNLETADDLYLYLLTVDGRLFSVHGLPANRQAVVPPGAQPWTHQIKPLMASAMKEVTRIRPFDIDVAVRVDITFEALEALSAQMAVIPGRKNLVWITDGVPIELGPTRSDTGMYVDFTPQLRKLGEELDQLGISIYPVRQVIMGGPDGIGTASGVGQTGGAGTGVQSLETLDQFASMTGGRPDGGKDIAGALKQAMNDVHRGYLLAYYPPERNWDNKFHKLRVTCTRKGVRIQTKTGYYAWAEPPGDRAVQAFNIASGETFDAAAIGLRAHLISVDPAQQSGEQTAHFDIRLDAGDIALVPDAGAYTAQLRLLVAHYLFGGQVQRDPITPIDLAFSPQQRDQAVKDGIHILRDITVHNGEQVRFMIFDRGSNSIGSVTIPINLVPDPQK